jgi:hypothetical protein
MKHACFAIGVLVFAVTPCAAAQNPPAGAAPAELAGNSEVRRIMETYAGHGTLDTGTKPLAPAEAMKRFKTRPDLAIDLIAAEPDVRQPVNMTFDSRGRLWVTQYLQFQFPAGLKVVNFDQYLRTEFDKVPPPPHGVKGADKITVWADSGDGMYSSHKTSGRCRRRSCPRDWSAA